jgi:hypothetical protein
MDRNRTIAVGTHALRLCFGRCGCEMRTAIGKMQDGSDVRFAQGIWLLWVCDCI